MGYALHFGYQECMMMQISEFLEYAHLAKEILEKTHGVK
ncbi:hypothetical protein HBZC1_17520 [Helicobacter bizzozeronii CIII-1]|uniref:Uncharacterized protein n=1 Tax=Helicobacter bizzozeronii (strain CIII-1) TaxID=1002804 RepID=F8KPL4_HELBC|nr:hypothetical protein HBZC1_17520 [Helicobacter bizzozeronii CIII-1]